MMDTVITKSGTKIAYKKSGSGSPIVVVHGSLSDASSWQGVASILEQNFTVYAVNRRGREGSDPLGPHALEDVFEDIATVIEAVAEPVHLFGHSYGAHCALGATLHTDSIRSLMLYEPPPPGTEDQKELHAELSRARSADELVATFLKLGPGVPQEAIELIKQSPVWPVLASLADTLVEETDAIGRYEFDPTRFADLTMPVLLLSGDQSPPALRIVMDAVKAVASNARLVNLKGQGHAANMGAPDLLAGEIVKFVESVEEKT